MTKLHINADTKSTSITELIKLVNAREKSSVETQPYSLEELYEMHHHILWEDGFHKYCVCGFIRDLDRLLHGQRFVEFPQETLDALIGQLREKGNSNATINRKLAALSKLLKKAHRNGNLLAIPEFHRLREKNGRIRFLEHEEEARLFKAIQHHSEHYYHLSVFLIDTGARLGEAIGLRWNDIANEQVTFWVTKSGRSRTIPLTQRAKDAVLACKGKNGGPFLAIKQYKYRATWKEAQLKCGMGDDKDVVPHILRHTCASRLVQGGVDMRRIQIWLGHQTLQMTMRYAHLATKDLDVCLSVLEGR